LVYLSGPLIATLIRRTTGVIIRTIIAHIITTITRTGTGIGATTVIGITTMMIKPKRLQNAANLVVNHREISLPDRVGFVLVS
jgi:hypothetical protein